MTKANGAENCRGIVARVMPLVGMLVFSGGEPTDNGHVRKEPAVAL